MDANNASWRASYGSDPPRRLAGGAVAVVPVRSIALARLADGTWKWNLQHRSGVARARALSEARPRARGDPEAIEDIARLRSWLIFSDGSMNNLAASIRTSF